MLLVRLLQESFDKPIDKHPDPMAQVAIGGVDDMKGVRGGAPFFEQRNQGTALDVLLHRISEGVDDAQSRKTCSHMSVTFIDAEYTVPGDFKAFVAAFKDRRQYPTGACGQVVDQTVFVLQCFGMCRPTELLQIRRCRAGDPVGAWASRRKSPRRRCSWRRMTAAL